MRFQVWKSPFTGWSFLVNPLSSHGLDIFNTLIPIIDPSDLYYVV